jgi:hypothetical protein
MVKAKKTVTKFTEFSVAINEAINQYVKRFGLPEGCMNFDAQITCDDESQEVLCVLVSTPSDGSPFTPIICKCVYPIKDSGVVEDAEQIALELAWETMDAWGWDSIMEEFLNEELI